MSVSLGGAASPYIVETGENVDATIPSSTSFLCQACGRIVACTGASHDGPYYGNPPKRRTFCSERCLAQLITTYWRQRKCAATVVLRDGFARVDGRVVSSPNPDVRPPCPRAGGGARTNSVT
jgi:hypothetical protein